MGKGRAPCCDKSKVKKGPWSPAEDLRLISFIQKHGHPNWRALPKQAGLLRCGKSCRLRWINYLRPDVKRGNFTPEEEETIIKLHTSLGNKWSKIAAHFPGRTDNEIKNVWNTHLKKRLLMNKKDRDSRSSSTDDDVSDDKNETIISTNISPTTKDASNGSPNTSCSSSSSSSSSSTKDDQTATEVPQEIIVDMEIWDMLDTLDDTSPQNQDFMVDKQVEWLRYLENELGLVDSPNNNNNNNHAQPQKDNDSDHNSDLVLLDSSFDDMATSLYFPTWPPCSPQDFGV